MRCLRHAHNDDDDDDDDIFEMVFFPLRMWKGKKTKTRGEEVNKQRDAGQEGRPRENGGKVALWYSRRSSMIAFVRRDNHRDEKEHVLFFFFSNNHCIRRNMYCSTISINKCNRNSRYEVLLKASEWTIGQDTRARR